MVVEKITICRNLYEKCNVYELLKIKNKMAQSESDVADVWNMNRNCTEIKNSTLRSESDMTDVWKT